MSTPRWTRGPLGHVGTLERAAVDLLEAWETTYLSDAERVHQLPSRSLPVARTWEVGTVDDLQPQTRLPMVAVKVASLTDVDTDADRFHWWGTVTLTLTVIHERETLGLAEKECHELLAAHRACLLDHQSIDGTARYVLWSTGDYDRNTIERQHRRIVALAESFTVGAILGDAGRTAPPLVPPVNPYDPVPGDTLITDTTLDVIPETP